MIMYKIKKACYVLFTIYIMASCFVFIGNETKAYQYDSSAVLPDINQMSEWITDKGVYVSSQTWTREGETTTLANPGVYLYQDNDSKHTWIAETWRGNKKFPDTNPRSEFPGIDTFENKINMTLPVYKPTSKFTLVDKTPDMPFATMANLKLVGANNQTKNEDRTSSTVKLQIPDKSNLIITSKVGGDADGNSGFFYTPNSHGRFGANNEKFNVGYTTSVNVTWRGEYVERKKISITGVDNIKVGSQKNFKGMIATTEPVNVSANKTTTSNTEITTRSEAFWDSENKAVAEVGQNTGIVTAKNPGTAIISVKWNKAPYTLIAKKTITVTKNDQGDGGQGSGECVKTLNSPSIATTRTGSVMNPNATGEILGDDLANERHFDAPVGIPTSEHLYAQTWGLNYLYQNEFRQMKGTVSYKCNVKVTYTRSWKKQGELKTGEDGKPVREPDTDTGDEVTKLYSFELTPTTYSYWKIHKLEVLGIDHAEMNNYALPGEIVSLSPSNYEAPSVEFDQSEDFNDHVLAKEVGAISFSPEVVTSTGYTAPDPPDDTNRLKAIGDSQTQDPEVTNDTLYFDGHTIMDGSISTRDGVTPGLIPVPTRIPDQTLYEDQILINNVLVNKANTPSRGKIYYYLLPENMNGNGDQHFPIDNINNVTVHTPVVNYSTVSDDREHNQKTFPSKDRSAVILDRPFVIHMPTSGQHTNNPGYGHRDYAKYTKNKQVRFPFDVYNANRSQYIYKDTWIDVPVNQEYTTFQMPVWVDEENYDVEFRSIAENAPESFSAQRDANTNLINHAASDKIPIEVIGRVYDFKVTDVADYLWESVFRKYKGSLIPTGNSYWVGLDGIDGDKRGNNIPFTLPIRPGSHPEAGYKNVAVKTGYHFKFDLKTKGNMFDVDDSVQVTPSFYYIREDGKGRIPVDLYYRNQDQNFVKIGSSEDKLNRYVILNERLRNVPEEELTDTALYKYDYYYHFGQIADISRELYLKEYKSKITMKNTSVGGLGMLKLPEAVRTFIGPKSSIPSRVEPQRANASIQKWYGEYSLPADVYGVAAGTNLAEYGRTHGGLSERSPVFLAKGFFIVNFNIETLDEGNEKMPHLQYIKAPLMNQWKLEGYQRSFTDPYDRFINLQDGDVVFYHTDKSSRDDFWSYVTH